MMGAVLFLTFRFYRRDFEFTNKLKERVVCRTIMGAIIGYLWVLSGAPNSFNTIMAGALAPELAEGFFEKFMNDNPDLFKKIQGGDESG